MPPEPLPWDRKDFFKERKHERSESLGSAPRWRESSASHHGGSRGFTRWGSAEFRRPPGHAKQGGWHLFPEEPSHGYMPSRSADKLSEDDGGRRSVFRGDGRYSRSYRENRGSFAQRDWKPGNSWETNNGSLNTKPNDMNSSNPRSVDVVTSTSPPHSDSGNAWDSRQLLPKDQDEKVNGVTGLTTGQKCDGENPMGSLEWKPLKWSRSGSLSSRGSGLSHSSSSKSMGGVDSSEAKVAIASVNVNSVQSPSGDAAVCTTSAAACEEMTSRKKPRLGWGEGLAKYEKKKVDSPEDIPSKNDVEVCPLGINVADKSPRVPVFLECASPATPSSVACSSSPGMEEKSFVKNITVDSEVNNLCGSPGPGSGDRQEGVPFNLEKLDMSSIDTLSYSISDFLQSDEASSVDYSFVRSSAINKLLLLKDDALKALEVTEMEIDKLENELKSLSSGSRNNCPCTASSSSPSVKGITRTLEEQYDMSNTMMRPTPLHVISSGDGEMPLCESAMEERHAKIKGEDVDSPGTVTSKFIEAISSVKVPTSSDVVNQSKRPAYPPEMQSAVNERGQSTHDALAAIADVPSCLAKSTVVEGMCDSLVNDASELRPENTLCQSILTANKEAANEAYEALLMLLPRNKASPIIPRVADVTCDPSDCSIREKFATRKCLLKFKERALTLKFRAFHHLWKEDLRLLSLRKSRVKSQKKFESSLRVTLNGYQKHRSSIRSRFSSPVGNWSLVPTKELVSYATQLLSSSQMKHCRSNLKMPALILDEREKTASRFMSSNGLVEDPCSFEKERKMINPWTSEEQEIFLDKFAIYGKDFKKIASFLDHKTTADCVEFYYKNHKYDCFKRTKKKLEFGKQGKSSINKPYLVTSGKKWNIEVNTVSLDVLGDASLLAAQPEGKILEPEMFSGMFSLGGCSSSRISEGDAILERTSSSDILGSDREAVAADVLAGICGSISSEAMSSCITSSLDHGDLKYQKADAAAKRPLTPDVMESLEDETCSGESCGEMEPSDWTDEEKSALVQAVSTYGKDFSMISRCVRTRSLEQCKVFFSKARKCLGLDKLHPCAGPTCSPATDDDNGGVDSDIDDASALVSGSVECSDKAGSKMEEDLPPGAMRANGDTSDHVTTPDLQNEVNHCGIERMDVEKKVKDGDGSIPSTSKDGPELGRECVYPGSEPVGPKENAFPVGGLEVCGSTGTGAPSLDPQPLASLSPSAVQEPFVPKKGETNGHDSGIESSVEDPNAVVDTSSVPNMGLSGGLGINLNSDSKDEALASVEIPSFVPSPEEKAATSSRCGQVSSRKFDLLLNAEKLGCLGAEHSLKSEDSSQILRVYPIQFPAGEMNRDGSHCREFSDSKSLPNLDSNFPAEHTSTPPDCFLRKCSSAEPPSSTSRFPLGKRSTDQMDGLPNSRIHSSTTADKPSGTGDFKLFGQILTNPSPHQKPCTDNNESEEKGSLHPKLTVISAKSTPHCSLPGDGSSTLQKFDRNGYMGFSSLPLRSYGFWDGSRIQTGFSTMPDSALLLAKYPAAFSNYPLPATAVKVEQQPLHAAANKNSDCSLNGTSPLFSSRELSNGNGVAEYQVFRARDNAGKIQPFAVEMKQRQEAYPELPRCNGFEAISGLQPPGMGMIARNVVGRGGGVLVGGPCNGVSDPVAAIKMHYAQSEQLSGGSGSGSGSIIREEESWRGKADLGR